MREMDDAPERKEPADPVEVAQVVLRNHERNSRPRLAGDVGGRRGGSD
jgi:hypothetical protein